MNNDILHSLSHLKTAQTVFDPELLYVECRHCGEPLLWETGRTTSLLLSAGIDVSKLDASCLILSERCPLCLPGLNEFVLSVVRLPQPEIFASNHLRDLLDSVENGINTHLGSSNLFKMKPPHGNA